MREATTNLRGTGHSCNARAATGERKHDRLAQGFVMRLLVVATEILLPDAHGGATHVRELVRHLETRADVLLLARTGSHGDRIAAIGRPMRRLPGPLRTIDAGLGMPAALEVARRFRPDGIYERCTSYGLGAMLGRALDVPLITMVLDQRYSWLSLLGAGRLIATNTDLVPRAVRHKAVQVSWGANESLFRPGLDEEAREARAAHALGEAYVVGYSGSFKPWHGVLGLVRAAAELRDENIVFLLVGDGPQRGEAESLARSLGVRDRIRFTGAVDYESVPGVLAAADVCVAPFEPHLHGPSRKRGFTLDPLKVFEYLAMGKPTITIRADNIEALFTDGEEITLVGPGRHDELAAAIRGLRSSPTRAAAQALAGRARVLAHHTWDAHALHLMKLFRDIISERAAA